MSSDSIIAARSSAIPSSPSSALALDAVDASDVAVSVEHVSKRYRLREGQNNLISTLAGLGRRLMGRAPAAASNAEYFNAVSDASFQVRRGEALGLIGHNGAGKTTLLKLLSRITRPTHGTIQLKGRFSSLIELGAGFHPDLTGRENVYLNGVILGLTRAQIKQKFDEIVAFAELEKFIDTPVKRYSSGMYARLGFSVAAHVSPDIMLVDEVLAVGDASFQRRCYDFIHSFVRSGKTTVFVSHNLFVVEQLCDRVAWVDKGRILQIGLPSDVLPNYLDSQERKMVADAAKDDPSADVMVLGEAQLALTGISLVDAHGAEKEAFEQGEDITVRVRYLASQPTEQPFFVLSIVDAESGQSLFLASMLVDGNTPAMILGEGTVTCTFKQPPLMPRAYYVWGEVWAADRAKMLVRWQRLGGLRVVTAAHEPGREINKGSIRHTRADAPIRVAYEWGF